ncbi:MAG: ferritin family protein [Planctomycetes bacterium]|nr:ferritin family protein [Planctomycetota bacterium]
MANETAAGILELAANKENEAHWFYKKAAGKVKDPGAKTMLADLAEEELKHKALLEDFDAAVLKDWQPQHIQDLRISDFLEDRLISDDSSPQEIMIYAMKREDKAKRFYEQAAAGTSDASVKKTFDMLAGEEAKHKLQLEKLYDDVILKEN